MTSLKLCDVNYLYYDLFLFLDFSTVYFLFSVFLFLRKLLSVCLYCTSSGLNKSILLSLFLPCQFCSHNACTQLRRLSDTTGLDDSTAAPGSTCLYAGDWHQREWDGMGRHRRDAASTVHTGSMAWRRRLFSALQIEVSSDAPWHLYSSFARVVKRLFRLNQELCLHWYYCVNTKYCLLQTK